MSSTIAFKSARPTSTIKTSALDRLIARYALAHEAHEAPLVGCYLCLLDQPRLPGELAAAA
jgi:hypothetical protein